MNKSNSIVFILFFLFPVCFYGADGSGNWAGVQTWHDLAGTVAGDTYTVDSGTFTASTVTTISKAVNVIGGGIGVTFIEDEITTTGSWEDKCVIWVQTPATGTNRISGLDFSEGASKPAGLGDGIIYVSDSYDKDTTGRTRIDNCEFNLSSDHQRCAIRVNGSFGVTDNCTFNRNNSGFTHYIHHGNGLSWGDATEFGSDKFWFMEDCTDNEGTGTPTETIDSDRSGKFVIRYNTLNNTRLHTHGADSGTNQRGNRAVESYSNTWTSDNTSTPHYNIRSGTWLIYDETITNYNAVGSTGSLRAYRATDDYTTWSWGQADGTNGWDDNDDASNPYVSGTATSGSGTNLLEDTSKSWTTDEWRGYIAKNTTTGRASIITSNTATVLTTQADIGYSVPDVSWSTSDGYEINKVNKILDMPGLGAGTMTANSGTPQATDSAIEPIYMWDVDVNGGTNNGILSSQTAMILEGTHFYDDGTEPVGYTPYTYPHPLRRATVNLRKSRSVPSRQSLITIP